MASSSIAIVGAGFSGTLLALHLLRRCPPEVRIVLVERNSRFGHGQAYSTGNPSHLLNVPAGRMSAFHDRPADFLDWLRRHSDAAAQPHDFVPRGVYGAYVRSLLKEELRRAPRGRLELLRGAVLGIVRAAHPLRLAIERDRVIEADLAVLATGNFPPEPMPVADPSFYETASYRPDPWSPQALAGLDPCAPVLLIGTGLTMVDVAISLLDQGHTGPILALSRRGLLPRPHTPSANTSDGVSQAFPTSTLQMLRLFRQEASRVEAEGGSWQPIVDELRPFTRDVWQAMPLAEKARFLRHARPWWEVHRHRMPPAVAERISRARAEGQLQIQAGRIRGFDVAGDRVGVTYRLRGSDSLQRAEVVRVINCSGPGADYARIADPLIQSLLEQGSARADPLRLGLDVTSNCALLHRDGGVSRRVFAVGPVTKGAFWEITAVPDIRRQCELLAEHLAGLPRRTGERKVAGERAAAPAASYAI